MKHCLMALVKKVILWKIDSDKNNRFSPLHELFHLEKERKKSDKEFFKLLK